MPYGLLIRAGSESIFHKKDKGPIPEQWLYFKLSSTRPLQHHQRSASSYSVAQPYQVKRTTGRRMNITVVSKIRQCFTAASAETQCHSPAAWHLSRSYLQRHSPNRASLFTWQLLEFRGLAVGQAAKLAPVREPAPPTVPPMFRAGVRTSRRGTPRSDSICPPRDVSVRLYCIHRWY